MVAVHDARLLHLWDTYVISDCWVMGELERTQNYLCDFLNSCVSSVFSVLKELIEYFVHESVGQMAVKTHAFAFYSNATIFIDRSSKYLDRT